MTLPEQNFFLSLVESYIDAIECKQNDIASVDGKRKAWEIIARRFQNAPGMTPRTVLQLSKYWKNLKAKVKRSSGLPKRSHTGEFVYSTGDNDDRILAMLSRYHSEEDVDVKPFVQHYDDMQEEGKGMV